MALSDYAFEFYLKIPVNGDTDYNKNNCNICFSGTLAGQSNVGAMANSTSVRRLHHLPTRLGGVHHASWTQVQQSTHHQIHVLPDIPRVPHDPAHGDRYHAHLPGGQGQSPALLVRVGTSRLAQWTATVRTDQP